MTYDEFIDEVEKAMTFLEIGSVRFDRSGCENHEIRVRYKNGSSAVFRGDSLLDIYRSMGGFLPRRFRKRPVVIEAIQLESTIYSREAIIDWSGGVIREGLDGGLIIPTLEGDMVANTGDYIIKGVEGEFYPCKPGIFEKTYEEDGL